MSRAHIINQTDKNANYLEPGWGYNIFLYCLLSCCHTNMLLF